MSTPVPNSQKDISSIVDAFANSSGSGGGYIDPQNPNVYLGRKANANQNFYIRSGMAPSEVARLTAQATAQEDNLQNVSNQYYMWDDATRQKFRAEVALTGIDVGRASDQDMAKIWGSYAAQSAAYWMNGAGKPITPWDIISMDRKTREVAGPRTSTSTNMNLSSLGDAKYIAQQAARSLLGRDPTQTEINTLLNSLNAAERANPTTTTTVTQPSGDSTSTTTGGVSDAARAMQAQDQLKKSKEYGAFQAATTYYNDMISVIRGG